MERLQRLHISKDSEVIADGQTDSTGHSYEKNTLSSSSSSGDSAYQTASLVVDSFILDGSSRALSSDENKWNVVKASLSDVNEVAVTGRFSQSLQQTEFYWILTEKNDQLSATEKSVGRSATNVFSYLSRDFDQISNIFTSAIYLPSTVSSQELRPSLSSVASFTSNDNINTLYETILSLLSPEYFDSVPSPGLSDQILVNSDNISEKLHITPVLFDSSSAQIIYSSNINVTSQAVSPSVFSNEVISDQADNDTYNVNQSTLRSTPAACMLQSSTVPLTSRIRTDQLVYLFSLSTTKTSNLHSVLANFVSSCNGIIPADLVNFEPLSSGKISKTHNLFQIPVAAVKTEISVTELHDITKDRESQASLLTLHATQTYSRLDEIQRASSFNGVNDVANPLIRETSPISHSDIKIIGSYPEALNDKSTSAYATSSLGFETASNIYVLDTYSEDIIVEEWPYRSQVVSITTDETPPPLKPSTHTQNSDILSAHLIRKGSYQLFSRNHDSPLLRDDTRTFSPADSAHILTVPALLPAINTWDHLQPQNNTNPIYTVNMTVNKFSLMDNTDHRENVRAANLTTVSLHFSDSSAANEVKTFAENVDSLSEIINESTPSGDNSRLYILNMEQVISPSTILESSSTLKYDSIFYYPSIQVTGVVSDVDVQLSETITHHFTSQTLSFSSTVPQDPSSEEKAIQQIHSSQSVDTASTVMKTSDCSGILCPSHRLTSLDYVSSAVNTTYKNTAADGGTSAKQMPNFNTTIIIASACAVLALVILVVIALFCLRRKNKSKSPPSRSQGDSLWVDLYRSNSAHHMPLPSLTTCASTFEMTEVLKPDVNQEKMQRQVSSFQIKKPQPETDQELGVIYPVLELEAPTGLDQAECWVNMTNVSMTSLPTTDVSYVTNVTDYTLAAVGHKFRAVYAYKPVCKGEMPLKEGEVLICKERDRNGWMFGSKPRTNEEGWFPAVYVDEISSDDELDLSCDIPETYDLLESNKLHNVDQYWTGIEHKVCYSYESSVPGDLNLEPGQMVIVLQTLANGWWFAVNGNKCGWFPGSYVELIEDNSDLEPSIYDIKQLDQSNVSVNSQNTNENNMTALSQFLESEEIKEKYAKQVGANEKALYSKSSHTDVIKLNSCPVHEIGDNHASVEPRIGLHITTTPHRQAPDKPESITMIPSHSVSLTRKSTQDKRLRKSLRPARPAPPPPKLSDSQIRKDKKLSTQPNSEIQINRAQAEVKKKQVYLIHGKRPKLQKILRSQLDEKQLNPMIRPSTRGFVPTPTANVENRLRYLSHLDNQRSKCNSLEREHTNSSSSIADDLHNELMIMLGKPHEPGDYLSPSQAFNFRRLSQNDGRSSTSLEFASDSKLTYPGNIYDNQLNMKENSSNIEHSEIKHPKAFLNNRERSQTPDSRRERSQTPDSRRERSITPDYKREKSSSPILLTTGNLLQNVQRFHGALRHSSPSSSIDTDNGTIIELSAEKEASDSTPSNTPQFSIASRRQRTPRNVSPPKVPSIQISQNVSLSNAKLKKNFNQGAQNTLLNSESVNEAANLTMQSLQPISIDINSKCNMTDDKNQLSKSMKPDNTALNRDSFIVIPGTVSEIVQQINKQSPLQN